MKSIATSPISQCSPRSCTADGPPRRIFAAAIACLALCLWITGAATAHADDLLIDLRARPPWVAEPDDRHDLMGVVGDVASYDSSGPANIDLIRLSPWPPKQGQTLIVTLQARRPVTLSLSFLGRTYPVHRTGAAGWGLAPVPALQQADDTPLTVRAGKQQLTVVAPIEPGTFETNNIPASAATPILSNTMKVAAEAARLSDLFAAMSLGQWGPASRFTPPLRGEFPHTSPFGSRRTYGNSPILSAHEGEDYGAAAGTAVYAPAEGVVMLAEKLFVRGNAVILDHGYGVFTGYWHLSEIGVKPGEKVQTGQLIGKVGSTGLSTGAHLHWEMAVQGIAVDPLQWVAGE